MCLFYRRKPKSFRSMLFEGSHTIWPLRSHWVGGKFGQPKYSYELGTMVLISQDSPVLYLYFSWCLIWFSIFFPKEGNPGLDHKLQSPYLWVTALKRKISEFFLEHTFYWGCSHKPSVHKGWVDWNNFKRIIVIVCIIYLSKINREILKLYLSWLKISSTWWTWSFHLNLPFYFKNCEYKALWWSSG